MKCTPSTAYRVVLEMLQKTLQAGQTKMRSFALGFKVLMWHGFQIKKVVYRNSDLETWRTNLFLFSKWRTNSFLFSQVENKKKACSLNFHDHAYLYKCMVPETWRMFFCFVFPLGEQKRICSPSVCDHAPVHVSMVIETWRTLLCLFSTWKTNQN